MTRISLGFKPFDRLCELVLGAAEVDADGASSSCMCTSSSSADSSAEEARDSEGGCEGDGSRFRFFSAGMGAQD